MKKIIMNNNENKYNIFHYIYATLAFFSMGPYFTWSTYKSGRLSLMPQLLGILAIVILLGYLLRNKNLKSRNLAIGMSLFFIGMYQRFIGMDFESLVSIIKAIASILTVSMFLVINEKDRYKIFNIFIRIFALSLISSIIVWVLTNLGVSLSYNILETSQEGKATIGRFYHHYPGSVFLANQFGSYNRLSGVFDEPGVVGTFSAILLAAENYEIKKKWHNITLLVAGLLSFSLAFYLLMMVGISIKCYKQGVKKLIIITVLFIVGLFIFVNMDIDNPFIERYIQDRIFTEDSIIISNRTKEVFDLEFKRFMKEDSLKTIIGHGHEASKSNSLLRGSYSYKMLIYDYGILGFSLLIMWIVVVSRKLNTNNSLYQILMFVFLLSIYQRPYIFNEYYFVVLFGGYANLRMISYHKNKFKLRSSDQQKVKQSSHLEE